MVILAVHLTGVKSMCIEVRCIQYVDKCLKEVCQVYNKPWECSIVPCSLYKQYFGWATLTLLLRSVLLFDTFCSVDTEFTLSLFLLLCTEDVDLSQNAVLYPVFQLILDFREVLHTVSNLSSFACVYIWSLALNGSFCKIHRQVWGCFCCALCNDSVLWNTAVYFSALPCIGKSENSTKGKSLGILFEVVIFYG